MGVPEANTTLIYGIHIRESANDGSDFSNGATDYRVLFLGEDGLLHVKDSSGTVTNPFSGSGAVATDAIWDAAGDLAIGTGANTAAKLVIGANATVLTSNGTTATWAAPVDAAGFTTIVKSADQDVTNNTFQDDSEMQFAVTAAKHYMVECFFMVSGSDTTGDFQGRFAVSAGTMDGRGLYSAPDATLAYGASTIGASAAANTGNIPVGTPADSGFPEVLQMRFSFRQNTTGGTFKWQYGQISAAAARVSRMMKGSFMRYKQTD